MAIQPRDKLEDFKYSIDALVAPKLTHRFSAMAQGSEFATRDVERTALALPGEIARAQENEILMSNGSIDGQTARSGQLTTHQRKLMEERRIGKKIGGMDVAFLQLLDIEIDRLRHERDALRDEISAHEIRFEEQYGSDWREKFAGQYLNDEELAALDGLEGQERQDAIVQALMDKMLNPDGSIKDAYKGSDVAAYLQKVHREREVDELVKDAKIARDSGDPEQVHQFFQSVDADKVKAVASETVENKDTGKLTGAWRASVSSEAGQAVAIEADASDVLDHNDSNGTLDFLNGL